MRHAHIASTAVLGMLALGIATAEAASPSFNCRKASHITERTICKSPTLTALDRDLAGQYKALQRMMRKVGDFKSLRELETTQRRWILERNDCRDNRACIERTYLERLQLLGDWEFGEA